MQLRRRKKATRPQLLRLLAPNPQLTKEVQSLSADAGEANRVGRCDGAERAGLLGCAAVATLTTHRSYTHSQDHIKQDDPRPKDGQ
jgi:hypothetical protein